MDSFIGWVGGKRLLRNEIIGRFPPDGMSRYVEVFGGAGWVLFGKQPVSGQLEVFNDVNSHLTNLFRCVKYHCGEVQKELEWMVGGRETFFDCRQQLESRGLTDIQRAARFLYVVKVSFGSDTRTFATSGKGVENVIDYLPKVQKRLRGVVIENKDFANLIKVYDRAGTLFYLDPPYFKAEGVYDAAFGTEDHQRLKDTLDAIKGKFILSYNDSEFIREMYSGYKVEEVTRKELLSSSGGNVKPYAELIIRNY